MINIKESCAGGTQWPEVTLSLPTGTQCVRPTRPDLGRSMVGSRFTGYFLRIQANPYDARYLALANCVGGQTQMTKSATSAGRGL